MCIDKDEIQKEKGDSSTADLKKTSQKGLVSIEFGAKPVVKLNGEVISEENQSQRSQEPSYGGP